MKKSNDLNDIKECLSGEKCTLGIPHSEIRSWKDKLLATNKNPICIVTDWIIWDFDITDQDKQKYLDVGLLPSALFSQCIIWDEQARWPPGACVKTTPLVKLMDDCIFHTKNTTYLLVEHGQRTTIKPELFNSLHF